MDLSHIYLAVHSIPYWFFLAEIKCMLQVAILKQTVNQIVPALQKQNKNAKSLLS